MDTNEMFVKASRIPLRFEYKGTSSVEDLWKMSLVDLDGLFKSINKELKATKEESLLDIKSEADKLSELKVEIVKYIVGVLKAEKKAKEDRKANAELRQKYLSLAAEKGEVELRNLSKEELLALADSLKED